MRLRMWVTGGVVLLFALVAALVYAPVCAAEAAIDRGSPPMYARELVAEVSRTGFAQIEVWTDPVVRGSLGDSVMRGDRIETRNGLLIVTDSNRGERHVIPVERVVAVTTAQQTAAK